MPSHAPRTSGSGRGLTTATLRKAAVTTMARKAVGSDWQTARERLRAPSRWLPFSSGPRGRPTTRIPSPPLNSQASAALKLCSRRDFSWPGRSRLEAPPDASRNDQDDGISGVVRQRRPIGAVGFSGRGKGRLLPALFGGMAPSIVGMALRWLSSEVEQRREKAEKEPGRALGPAGEESNTRRPNPLNPAS
jgi:hypothetical protein